MGCLYSCCFKPKDNYGTFLCCLPLALATLILSLVFGFWCVWDIVAGVKSPLFPDFTTVSLVVIGCVCGLFALFGLLALVLRVEGFMGICKCAFSMLIGFIIIAFIYQWVVWGLQLGGVTTVDKQKWKPTDAEIVTMVLTTIITVVIFIAGYWILGLLGSLGKVFGAGGNGWERKNYREVAQKVSEKGSKV